MKRILLMAVHVGKEDPLGRDSASRTGNSRHRVCRASCTLNRLSRPR